MFKLKWLKIVAGFIFGLALLACLVESLTQKTAADSKNKPPQNKFGNEDTLVQYNDKGVARGAINLVYRNDRLGVGEPYPANLLDVAGSMAIGIDYTASAAPHNGLMVQGQTLIGYPFENSTGAVLQVTGSASFTKNIIVGSAKTPTGITIYDKANSKPYCLEISNGTLKNVLGECADIAVQLPV